jgi:hypothetical protein
MRLFLSFPLRCSTCACRGEIDHTTMQVRRVVHLACLEKINYGAQGAASSSLVDRSIAAGALVRTETCVRGPGIYCSNKNRTPSSLGTRPTLPLSLSPSPFYLPLLLFNSSSPQFSTSPSRACSLRLPPANTNTRTHPRPATNPKQESMDLVAPSEHLCYVRCTFCDTVLAVNSSRNRIRSKQHMCGDHAWRSRRVIARHVISFAL